MYEKPHRRRSRRSPTPKRTHKDRSSDKKKSKVAPKKKNKKEKKRTRSERKVVLTPRRTEPKTDPNKSKPTQDKRTQRYASSSSHISAAISESSDSDSDLARRKRKLSRDLRKSEEGRERFDDFDRADFGREAYIFFESGYYRIEAIRHMQDHDRAFFISNL